LSHDQFNALVLGLPWQRLEQLRCITRIWSGLCTADRIQSEQHL